MPVYEYTALNQKGKSVTGIVDAESSQAARQKLRSTRIFPISIKEAASQSAKKEQWSVSAMRYFTRVKPAEVTMMTRLLSTLIGAGFPLVSAIDSLIPQSKSHAFQRVVAQIKDSIVEGNSFAASLSLFPNIFPPLYINMVSAGETSGTLEIVMDRLADLMEKQEALKNKITTALAYPLLMAAMSILVVFFLLTNVIPTIANLFEEVGQAMPTPTRILIGSSEFVISYWWMILIMITALVFVYHRLSKTERGRYAIDRALLKIPGFGKLAQKLAAARFARTLGSLLENGVNMLTALDIVRNIVGNTIIRDAIAEAAQEVGKGQALGYSLGETKVFPSLTIQMIQVGEQSGELEKMLNRVADVYENDVENTIMKLTSLLEPIMIVVMAVIIGFIVLSICLPIFEMRTLIR